MARFSFAWLCIISKLDFVESISETDDNNELAADPEDIWESVGEPGAGISIPEN